MPKTPIADRLEASLELDVLNGVPCERIVLAQQIHEAVRDLRRMSQEIRDLQSEVSESGISHARAMTQLKDGYSA